MGKIKDGKLLYHLTKLENLDSILKNGLVTRKYLHDLKAKFQDVANDEIIDKRKTLGLDCYVPFHFHPYSSFDVSVKNTYGTDEFVYICITRELAQNNNFKIITSHPLNQKKVELCDYQKGFEAIDWEAMEGSSSDNTHNREVRMAECLTDKFIPADYFASIAVRTEEVSKIVENKLKEYKIEKPPYVDIQPWLNRD